MKKHPDYHRGYFDSLDDKPLPDDYTPEYRAGWDAAARLSEAFRDAGFTKDGRGFTVGLSYRRKK